MRRPVPNRCVSPAVHQASPDRTLAVWLDLAPDLSCTNSIQDYCLDVEHQPTDLATAVGQPSGSRSRSIHAACPVRLPCLLTRPSPGLQFGRSVVGRRQGAACSSRSFKVKPLTRTLSAPSWTAGRL